MLEGDCPLSLEGQPQLERREGMTPPPSWCLELNGVELSMNYPSSHEVVVNIHTAQITKLEVREECCCDFNLLISLLARK